MSLTVDSKSLSELNVKLLSLKEDKFKLRMQKNTAQLTQNHLLKLNRKEIARIKTAIRQLNGK